MIYAGGMSTTQQQLGNLIASIRQRRQMTQKQLADAVKTSQSAIARIERGEQNMSVEMLGKISDALGRSLVNVSTGAMSFKIEGGKKLRGSIDVKASKNATVGLLCASLLNRGTTTLKHVPRIEEVYRLIEVLESIGVKTRWLEDNDLMVTPPKKLKLSKLDVKAAARTRSIIMFLGPLMHHTDAFRLPYAGGCQLGTRTVRPHLYGLEELGLRVAVKDSVYEVSVKKRAPAEIVLYEAGDTVTENVVMAAALIPGKTTIKFASANYMVQEVCYFLESLGVRIDGIGTTTLVVHGVDAIDQDVTYAPSEDPIEAMSFLAAAIVTGSSITIKRCPIAFLELELLKLKKMGFKYRILRSYKADNGKTDLVDIKTEPSTLRALKEKIAPRPYPGINMDNLPFFVPIAAVAKGRTLIHDWPYDNRALYYTELNKLGANVSLIDIHRAYVDGPTTFRPAEHICPPALRPGMVMLLGMLAAKGTSILRNVYSINRGYEDIANRLNKLGAKITVLQD